MVHQVTAEPVVGEVYEGTVKSTKDFGAFIEIMPGTEALLHISEMAHGRTQRTEDVVKIGDRVKVKLIERDERGRMRLSMKALVPKPEGEPAQDEPAADASGNGGGRDGGREREHAGSGPRSGGDGEQERGRRPRRGQRSRGGGRGDRD
jgi:polyribonucleotide nucleotidyltransferase